MKTSRPCLLLFLVAFCLISSSMAQVTDKPQRKPGLVLVDTDDPCHLTLDGTDEGVISPTATKKLEVSIGEHILKCTIESIPDLVWRKVVEVKNSDQIAALIALKALHLQYDDATSQLQKQKGGAGSQAIGGPGIATAAAQPAKGQATTPNSRLSDRDLYQQLYDAGGIGDAGYACFSDDLHSGAFFTYAVRNIFGGLTRTNFEKGVKVSTQEYIGAGGNSWLLIIPPSDGTSKMLYLAFEPTTMRYVESVKITTTTREGTTTSNYGPTGGVCERLLGISLPASKATPTGNN